MENLKQLPKPFFVLAPMDDVTDSVFRQVVAGCAAPDLYFTEFTNVDGLQSPGRPRLLKKLRFTAAEQPLIAQIWGREPENFYTTAREIADGSLARELGAPPGTNFAGIDLNMGCPEKSAVRHGTCSALINDRPLAEAIIKATRQGLSDSAAIAADTAAANDGPGTSAGPDGAAAGPLPLSVKTRTGYGNVDLSWIEFLLGQDLAMLTLHGRTKAQMSKVPADWDVIGQARGLRDRLAPDTLFVGNGDVMTRRQGEELAARHRLDGIMIGRGVFQDPFVYAAQSPWPDFTPQQRIGLYRKHVELFARTWQHRERPIHTLNKFCKIYINHFDGAKELREQLMAATSADELLQLLEQAEAQTAPA
jgi:tRNA-dihydrouridine synthase